MPEIKDHSQTPTPPPVHDQINQGGEHHQENILRGGGQRGNKGQAERGAARDPDDDETDGPDGSPTV